MSPASKTILRAVVFSLAGFVLVFLGVGALLADRWDVNSERTVNAPPARVEPLLRDFTAWRQWWAMDVDLGPQTRSEVTGEPGAAGHRVTWTGPQGVAMLTMTKVEAGRIDYDFHTRRAGAPEAALAGRGRIAYAQDGEGTAVTWHDEGQLQDLVERWIGWFGALQEHVRSIQGASLAGLQRSLDTSSPR